MVNEHTKNRKKILSFLMQKCCSQQIGNSEEGEEGRDGGKGSAFVRWGEKQKSSVEFWVAQYSTIPHEQM